MSLRTTSLALKGLILTITNLVWVSVALSVEITPGKIGRRIVSQKEFCSNMLTGLTGYAAHEGLSSRDAIRFARLTSQTIQKQLKQGDLDPYFETTSLQSASTSQASARRWIDVTDVVTAAMGVVPINVLSVTTTDDLKMVSQVAPGAQILLLASSLGPLNAERALAVAEAAQFSKIQINIIWVGPVSPRAAEAKDALASLATATGGAFLDLSSARACSGV